MSRRNWAESLVGQLPQGTVAELEAYAELAQLAERWRIRTLTAGAEPKTR